MLDTRIRKQIDPLLNRMAERLVDWGVTANSITWTGFAIGVYSAVLIAGQNWGLGLVFLLVSRLCDGLDGAVARKSRKTDFGGYLDIVLDFGFYGLIPLAFIIANPQANAIAGGVLLLTFYINGASFLTYALMAEKQGLDETARGEKSLLYTVGLAEATETIVVFVLFCLFPDWFSPIAYFFSAIVLVTTISRFVMAWRNFGD